MKYARKRNISTISRTRNLPKDMLDLAKHIVDSKKAEWKPERFEDQYEDALKELLKKKQSGQKIEAPREREPSKVINLMDALRRSVETEGAAGGERRKPASGRGSNHRAPKKAGRSSARAKKAGWLVAEKRNPALPAGKPAGASTS